MELQVCITMSSFNIILFFILFCIYSSEYVSWCLKSEWGGIKSPHCFNGCLSSHP